MRIRSMQARGNRRGVIALKVAILLIPMMAMLALTIDYGILLKEQTDLQCAADAAALAAVRELVPDENGFQNKDSAKAMARQFGTANINNVNQLQILDADIQIGRYDPSKIYSSISLLNNGMLDTVRVTIRRDATANSPVQLLFARILGYNQSSMTATATAVLQKSTRLYAGDGVLPFAVSDQVWNATDIAKKFRIHDGGKIENGNGQTIPGNWGTIDIGNTNNSTSDLSSQIRNGLRQRDLSALYNQGQIPTSQYIETSSPLTLQGDPGLSAGMKHAVEDIQGTVRYVPIFNNVSGNGNNAQYDIIGWGVVRLTKSNFQGSKNTFIEFERTYTYDAKLTPQPNLSNSTGVIEGAYSTPALVE